MTRKGVREILALVFSLLVLVPLAAASRPWDILFQDLVLEHLVLVETNDGFCTGEMVKKDLFLTAAHCVQDDGYTIDQFQQRHPFHVKKRSVGFDLALVESKFNPKHPITIARTGPAPGTVVYAVGYSLVTRQIVVGYIKANFLLLDEMLYKVDMPIKHGYSGGPLVNEDGQLVGVDVATLPLVGFAVPLETVRYFMELDK